MSHKKRYIKNRVKKRKRWFWILVLAILFISVFIYFFVFSPGFQVDSVVIYGNHKTRADEIRRAIFSGVTINLIELGTLKISSKSVFLVNKKDVEKRILQELPVVESITVQKKLPQELVVNIIERESIGIYCGKIDLMEQCFIFDKNGILFENAHLLEDSLPIVRKSNADQDHPELGQKILSEDVTSAFLKICNSFKSIPNIEALEAETPNPDRLNVLTNEGWQIYFGLGEEDSIDNQLIKLQLLLSEEISTEARKTLQYIDLRFEDRAYYK